MKKVRDGTAEYMAYVDKTFHCSKTHAEYRIEVGDILKLGEDGSRKKGVTCPDCGKFVSFESDQRDGYYLSHH